MCFSSQGVGYHCLFDTSSRSSASLTIKSWYLSGTLAFQDTNPTSLRIFLNNWRAVEMNTAASSKGSYSELVRERRDALLTPWLFRYSLMSAELANCAHSGRAPLRLGSKFKD